MRILLADDDELFLKIVTEILEENGHEVIPATDGSQALELANSRRPDLIILDIILPGILGTEVSEKLRKHDLTASIPVLLVTSGSNEIVAEGSCVDCFMADDFMRKPFSRDKLLEKVELLSKKPSKFSSQAGRSRADPPEYPASVRDESAEVTEDSSSGDEDGH